MSTGMGLALAIYMIDILHSVDQGGVLFIVTGILGAVACVLLTGFYSDYVEEDANETRETKVYNRFMGLAKKWLLVNTLLLTAIFLAPDKETSYTMLAAFGLGSAYDFASENEEVNRIATKSLQMIERHIDSYMVESTEKEETTNE